jgi:hypothetical protein
MKNENDEEDREEPDNAQSSEAPAQEIRISVKPVDGKVLVEFGMPVAWLHFGVREARVIAIAILQNADAAEFPPPPGSLIQLPPGRKR